MKINITVLLDRSGSMDYRKDDHIGGLRSFVKDQQNREGETKLTLIQFDGSNSCEVHIDNKVIEDIKDNDINLIPRGSTPLFDAVGKALAFIEEKEQNDKSDQVIFVVLTDGEENSSKEWTKDRVQAAIKKIEDDYVVMFLGAEMSAWSEGGSIGFTSANIMPVNYQNTAAVSNMYNMSSNKINHVRGIMTTGCSKLDVLKAASYTDLERSIQTKCNTEE